MSAPDWAAVRAEVVSQLWGEGQRELADELAARVAGRALSFAPVVRAVEEALA